MPSKGKSTDRVQKHRRAMQEQKDADNKLLVELCRAFPGQIRFSLDRVDDPDLGPEALRVKWYASDETSAGIVRFALERGIDIDVFFDRVMKRGINNFVGGDNSGPDKLDRMERL